MIFRRVFLTGNGGFFVGLVLSLCENIHWDVGDTESGVCDTPPYRVHLINQYGKAIHPYINFFIKSNLSYGGYFILKSIVFEDFRTPLLLLNAKKLSRE